MAPYLHHKRKDASICACVTAFGGNVVCESEGDRRPARTKDGGRTRHALMLRLLVLLTAAASAAVTGDGRRSARVVTTKYGALRGFLAQPGRSLSPVEIYLGVPYASAPFGSLRFMPPVTVPHWKGIKQADRHGPVCPQHVPDISNETESLRRMPAGRLEYLKRLLPVLTNQSEDCLHLNIYVPATVRSDPHGSRMAVVVFVHGESYEWNSGNAYDGSVLSSFANVLVVTINYRLGVFGFLPTLDANTRGGNNGLMDQVAALHWIQENIAEFGGDPRNVTIVGHGHGAACVHLLMLSPMAKNLFQRGILMSGSALSSWAIAREARSYARQLGEALRCPITDNLAFLSCMRSMSVSDILGVRLRIPDHLAGFGPTVDGIVVPKEPELLMRDEKTPFALYDLLFGVTKVESYFLFSAEEDRHGLEVSRRDRLLRTLVRNTRTYHLQEIFLTVTNEYTDWSKATSHPFVVMEAAADAMGESLVVAPLVRTANLHAQHRRRTFFYVFSHQTESGYYSPRMGCVVGEELAYLFGAPLVAGLSHFSRNFTKQEVALSESVMTFWTSFAKTGDPSGIPGEDPTTEDKSRKSSERVQWPLYDVLQQKYLTIGPKAKVKDHYSAHRLSLWLHLVPSLDKSRSGADPQHHLLEDHDNSSSYDGVVRLRAPLSDESPPTSQPTRPAAPTAAGPTNGTPAEGVPTTHHEPATAPTNVSNSMAVVMQANGYSTALSVTIAVGCSLLILNVLIFAGVYYQRDKKTLDEQRPSKMAPSSGQAESHFGTLHSKFVRLPTTSAAPEYLEHNAVVALLPPKVPPKPVLPPQEMPEAQPLLLPHGEPATRPLQEMRVF